MNTNVYVYENTDWDELMHKKCVCGHDLYMHGFTQHPNLSFDINGNWATLPGSVLWVSQCVNLKNGEYCSCKEFKFA